MAQCPSCKAEVVAGSRWCGLCRTNVLNQAIGRLASPGRRLGACFFDMLIPMIALFLIFAVAGAGASTGTDAGVGAGVIFGIILFAGYFVWALMLFVNGMTPGKKLLGIKVVKEDGRNVGFFTMLIREAVGKAISGMIFSLGFLWILFDRDKQGWHDKLVSTYVVQ